MTHRSFARVALAAAFLSFAAAETAAQVGATTATLRGRVLDARGAPLPAAQVTVRNLSTGVRTGTLTNAVGIYIVPFVPPGGPYRVVAQSLGYGDAIQEFERVRIGEVVTVDFTLSEEAVAIEGVEVMARAAPLIETREAGVIDRVSQIEIEALPTNGRNFQDFAALSPNVSVDVGDGSGGNLSLGGGRRGANNILMDGVGNNGTFFGGEARGSDRIAFAFSQETVKEFQIITNGFDVERGNFTGGAINAVTRSGSNEFESSFFYYRRDENLTGDGFDGLPPDEFTSSQFGGVVSGPIVPDRAHFLVSVDRQDRTNPVAGLTAPDVATGLEFGIHPDSLSRLVGIMENVYAVQDAAGDFGQFSQTNDETAIFARVDWQIDDRHSLTLRNNWTDLQNDNDRVGRNEGRSNGGLFEDRANSFVANLRSVLSPTVFNDLRLQYATESRPREAFSTLPEANISITSQFPDGSSDRVEAEVFNDAVLPNSLDEKTIQVVDNLVWQRGSHTFKVGTDNSFYDIDNFFFLTQFGDFRFGSLQDFEDSRANRYRIAVPGPRGGKPRAVYNAWELAFYAQDEWQATPRLNLTFGLRYDVTLFPDKPGTNADVLSVYGLDTNGFPEDLNNIAPRLGFAFDVLGNGRSVLKGGVGLFYGRLPSVFWSNALLNTGDNQSFVECSGSFFNTPEARAAVRSILRGERETFRSCDEIPGGAGFAFTPNVNGFDPDLEWPGAWKLNIGYDQEVYRDVRVGVDLSYGLTTDNFYNVDINVDTNPGFTVEGDRPVFVPLSRMRSDGSFSFGANRIDADYNDVLVMRNIADARTYRVTFEVERRFSENWSGRASYSWSRTKDHSSHSCCISSTAILETPTAGNLNELGDVGDQDTGTWGYADFDRTHTIIVSGVARLGYGFRLSGILRSQSGLPYTPIVDGDVNADGRDENDRAYIPSSATDVLWSTPADAQRWQTVLDRSDCLRKQQGRIARRNSCRNPWGSRVDLRVSWKLPTTSEQDIELILDAFNFLNLVNRDWGQQLAAGFIGVPLFTVEGFDASQRKFVYSVDEGFGEERPFGFTPRQWQIQLGIRYGIGGRRF